MSNAKFKRVRGKISFDENSILNQIKFIDDNGCGSELYGKDINFIPQPLDLSGHDLENSDLTGICNFENINLSNTNLERVRICADYEDQLPIHQGTPEFVSCNSLPKCPFEIGCRAQ
jgi:uncharacterized protein YjbI with pentapeptide repeats